VLTRDESADRVAVKRKEMDNMGMTTIHTKIDDRLKKAFDDKASKLGKPSDMIRTLMTAFVEDRVKIEPTTEQVQLFHYTKGELK